MHGKKRSNDGPSEAEKEALRKKTHSYQSLVTILFDYKKSSNASEETLDLTSKLLLSNPDIYSIWNYRKELIISQNPSLNLENMSLEKISSSVGDSIRDRELSLSVDCIKRNPKSYCSWYHRQWILDRFEINYESEFKLCKEFLKADQRNFHCWNYRRYLVDISHTEPMKEFTFAEEKIMENFSNYSAFHHRSIYMTALSLPSQEIITSELQIVENAVFTEPDDQTAWWYFNFLLVWGMNHHDINDPTYMKWFIDMLLAQYKSFQGLLELEPNCKWVMTSIVHILDYLIRLNINTHEIEKYKSHRRHILVLLCQVDGSHIRRYEYLLSTR